MRLHSRTSQTAPAVLPSNQICVDKLRARAPRSRQVFSGAEETGQLDQKVTVGSPSIGDGQYNGWLCHWQGSGSDSVDLEYAHSAPESAGSLSHGDLKLLGYDMIST